MRNLFVILGCLAGPAFGQSYEEKLQIFADDLEACFFTSDTVELQRDCVGDMATNCMDAEEGGHSTLGMSMCSNAEAEVWDRLLNQEYKATMAWAKSMDADEREVFPEFANRATALRDTQRAWIPFRDAECAMAYATWGAGSMRHIAGTSCMMDMTAERTIELRSMREVMQ